MVFNFSKKDPATRHVLKIKFFFKSLRKFSTKGLRWKNIVAKFQVYSLQPAALQKV